MNKRNKVIALSLLNLVAFMPHQAKPVNYQKLLSNWAHVGTVIGVPLFFASYFADWLPEEHEDGDFDYTLDTNNQENKKKDSVGEFDEIENKTIVTLWALPNNETSSNDIIIKTLCYNIKKMNELGNDNIERKTELLDNCLFCIKNIKHNEECTKLILSHKYQEKTIGTHILEAYEILETYKILNKQTLELKNN